MEIDLYTVLSRLFIALLAGGAIGLERAYHGRPAGFRTHSLVCVSSSLLMLLTVFQWMLLSEAPVETFRVDPTRMAQGIMTGIGFLGAGVIMKERLSVRGLTTAASIWMTASVGIIIGMGFYSAAFAATLITLGVLSAFSYIEKHMPSQHYAHLSIRFRRKDYVPKETLYGILEALHISGVNPSYHLVDGGEMFQYQMSIRTMDVENLQKLSDTMRGMENVHEFSITPTGD